MDEEIGVEEESPASEEQQVPLSRFKEVNAKAKALEKENESLKGQDQEKKKETDQELAEQQASEYISKKVEERLDAREKAKKEEEASAKKQFNEDVTDILEIFTDVDKKEFLSFYKDNDKELEFSSVKSAMATYRKINNLSKEAEEKLKDNLERKPSLPKNEGKATPQPIDDSNKSLKDIVQEEIAKLE